MNEVELASKFVDYLSDYDVYKEVPCSTGRMDIYAIRSPVRIAVEVKCVFSTKVIMQAVQNKRYANYSYVAIPKEKVNYEATQICKLLGIGVMTYGSVYHGGGEPYEVAIQMPAAYQRVIFKVKTLEKMKYATAGSKHNDMSEFKVTCEDMEMTIRRRGGKMLIEDLFREPYHYQSPKHAKRAIFRLIKNGVLNQFKIEGIYIYLTDFTTKK